MTIARDTSEHDYHTCLCDENGQCADDDRDWCPKCERCTEWDGENCTDCGHEWGTEPKEDQDGIIMAREAGLPS